jgi:hypothetical protein
MASPVLFLLGVVFLVGVLALSTSIVLNHPETTAAIERVLLPSIVGLIGFLSGLCASSKK